MYRKTYFSIRYPVLGAITDNLLQVADNYRYRERRDRNGFIGTLIIPFFVGT